MKKNDLETMGKCMAQNQIFLEQIGVSNDLLLSITKEVEKLHLVQRLQVQETEDVS